MAVEWEDAFFVLFVYAVRFLFPARFRKELSFTRKERQNSRFIIKPTPYTTSQLLLLLLPSSFPFPHPPSLPPSPPPSSLPPSLHTMSLRKPPPSTSPLLCRVCLNLSSSSTPSITSTCDHASSAVCNPCLKFHVSSCSNLASVPCPVSNCLSVLSLSTVERHCGSPARIQRERISSRFRATALAKPAAIEPALAASYSAAGARLCPNCCAPILKSWGCGTVRCSACSAQFSFYSEGIEPTSLENRGQWKAGARESPARVFAEFLELALVTVVFLFVASPPDPSRRSLPASLALCALLGLAGALAKSRRARGNWREAQKVASVHGFCAGVCAVGALALAGAMIASNAGGCDGVSAVAWFSGCFYVCYATALGQMDQTRRLSAALPLVTSGASFGMFYEVVLVGAKRDYEWVLGGEGEHLMWSSVFWFVGWIFMSSIVFRCLPH